MNTDETDKLCDQLELLRPRNQLRELTRKRKLEKKVKISLPKRPMHKFTEQQR